MVFNFANGKKKSPDTHHTVFLAPTTQAQPKLYIDYSSVPPSDQTKTKTKKQNKQKTKAHLYTREYLYLGYITLGAVLNVLLSVDPSEFYTDF
jgi:hypothetical protein